MNENIIQSQISLVGFKVVNLEYSCAFEQSNNINQPQFDLRLSDLLIENSPNRFAKVFIVELKVLTPEFNELVKVKVQFHTVFESSQKIDATFLASDFAKISAPAIGFPYLRAFVSNLSIQAGIPPIILPSINFVQFNMEAQKV